MLPRRAGSAAGPPRRLRRRVPEFTRPDPAEFNWALDWFDSLAADPAHADQSALRIAGEDGAKTTMTFRQLAGARTRWRTGCGTVGSGAATGSS